MDFAQQLREAMGDLTQEGLSDLTGGLVQQASISKYLLGKAKPKLEQLTALERALPKLRELRARSVA